MNCLSVKLTVWDFEIRDFNGGIWENHLLASFRILDGTLKIFNGGIVENFQSSKFLIF